MILDHGVRLLTEDDIVKVKGWETETLRDLRVNLERRDCIVRCCR